MQEKNPSAQLLSELLSEAMQIASAAKIEHVRLVLEQIKSRNELIAGIEKLNTSNPLIPRVEVGQPIDLYPACVTAIQQNDKDCFDLVFSFVTLNEDGAKNLLSTAAEQQNVVMLSHLLNLPEFARNYDARAAALLRAIGKDRVENFRILLTPDLREHLRQNYIDMMSEVVNHSSPKCLAFLNPDRDTLGSLLIAAAAKGHLDIVRKLIEEKGVSIEYKTPKTHLGSHDRYDVTALMAACAAGQVEVVRYLLSKRADVHARNSKGATAFLMICSDIHFDNAEDQYLACAQLLLERRADATVVDKYRKSAIHYIHDKNKPKLLALLLRSGLDPNTIIDMDNRHTVLREVMDLNSIGSARVLLEYGADPDIDLGNWQVWFYRKEINMLLVLAGYGLGKPYFWDAAWRRAFYTEILRCGHPYTSQEENIIKASPKLQVLSEALAQKELVTAMGLVDNVFNEAPELFIGYFRLLSARRRAASPSQFSLFQDPGYQLVILRVLALAAKAKNTPLYQQLALIIGQDIYLNSKNLSLDERNLLSLLFLMEGRGHEKFSDHPTARIARELMVGNRDITPSDRSLVERFPEESRRLSQLLANLRQVLFSPVYYRELESKPEKMPSFYQLARGMISYIRNGGEAALVANPTPIKEFMFCVNENGTLHSIHSNPASHALWKKLLTFKESGGISGFFSNRTSFISEIPEIAQRLLSIDYTPENRLTSQLDVLLDYIRRIESIGDYQQQLASAISLPAIIKEIKGYLETLKSQRLEELNPSSAADAQL